MRFSLKQTLTSLVLISGALGYAVTTGLGVAIVFAVLALLAWFCIVRAFTQWSELGRMMRAYAVATALGATVLLVTYVFNIATDPTFARERNTRRLLTSLSNDTRFRTINVAYHDRKITMICVDGRVRTDADFEALQSKILRYDWRKMDGIYWDVHVSESDTHHDGWDSDLFEEYSQKQQGR